MKTLWFAEGRTRTFLVPDSVRLAEGNYVLETSTGRCLLVDASEVAPYEVSRAEAAVWSREQLKSLWGGGRPDAGEADEEPPLPVFSTLSGESAEDLHHDPQALRRGLRQVGAKVGDVLKGALSASAEDRQQAREKLEELRAAVAEAEAAKGRDGGDGESEGGERGAEGRRQGAEKALRSFADLAGSLGRAAERAGARFGEAADELRKEREAARRDAEGDGPAERGDLGAESGKPGPGEDRKE